MPAAISISLPAGARWQLEQLRDGAKDARLVRRAQVVLMTADGKSVREIMEATGFKDVTVWKWRKRYATEGIQGIYERPRPGPKPKADDAYLSILKRTVMCSPRKMGYAFTVWTGGRLAEYMAQRTGVRLSADWVRHLLKHKLDFSYQRPKHTLKGKRDEKAYRKAKRRVEALKKGVLRNGADYELWFQDEAEFHLHPYLAHLWGRRGQQPRVPSPGQNKKCVVYGAINFVTGAIDYDIRKTKSGVAFLAQLKRLVKRAKRTGKKIIVVCDRPRFHKTKKVMAYLATVAEYLEVFYLSAYSPDLNLIERLWGHVKRTHIANVLFRSELELFRAVEDVFDRLNRRPTDVLEVMFRPRKAA